MEVRKNGSIVIVDMAKVGAGQDMVEMTEAIENLRRFLEPPTPFGMLVLADHGDGRPKSDPEIKKKWAAFLREQRQVFEENCKGVGYVTPSSIRRALVKATTPVLTKLFRAPVSAFSDEPTATNWLNEKLKA